MTYIPINNNDEDALFKNITKFNISSLLSAVITAYARIHMSHFKDVQNNYNLFYSDTDSISIDRLYQINL